MTFSQIKKKLKNYPKNTHNQNLKKSKSHVRRPHIKQVKNIQYL